jgi:hypothetical protein
MEALEALKVGVVVTDKGLCMCCVAYTHASAVLRNDVTNLVACISQVHENTEAKYSPVHMQRQSSRG